MTPPLVSIIIPAYNCAAYIAETIESVIAQTYTEWECIIVDDGSTDDTFSIAKEYSTKHSRISCYRQENSGPATARNTAIQNSCGEYLLPVDADDRIAPIYVEKCVNWFLNHPETTLVYGNVAMFGEVAGAWNIPDYNYEDFIWGNTIIICSAMFRREAFNQVGGYNPNMRLGYEDWDFWLSLLNKNSIVHRFDEVMYYYRITDRSRSSMVKKKQVELNRQLFYNHPDIYTPYISDIITIKQSANDYKNRLIFLEKELSRIRNTRAYRIGKFLIHPFSILKQR